MASELHSPQEIRKHIRRLRNQLTPQQQHSAVDNVMNQLLQHPKIQAAQHISLFISFDGEINTQPIIEALWQQQKSVYLPVLHPFSRGNLLFLRYTPQTAMKAHPFGLMEPKLNVNNVLPTAELDVIITPMVAFDAEGHRLGMGGGYYDRTLKHWQRNQTYPIGIAHDCQQVERLPRQSWDIPLPEIITPSQTWKW
ncbi:5-formyltetrahydrofolate cyclo-ligase [Budvicia diplopodorum]|uniref:5-formyltetrahydrofolate cyclo-ligase n=1 Tax=Budvicia diplopodorum TaxID=1119056 RepID=UPI00135B00BC|nr:5-formyltetrahydrofolate cyclo-ligase [Budvicia diplopodorum]